MRRILRRSALPAWIARALLVFALVPWAAGCGSAPAPLNVSWQFADGRNCGDAGASTVALTADGLDRRLGKFRCTEGLTPAEVTLGEASGDQLYVQALSAEGLALYVGRITRDATLGRGLVTLYATASR